MLNTLLFSFRSRVLITVVGMTLASYAARADTITFIDVAGGLDPVVVTYSSSQVTPIICNFSEFCQIKIAAPSGALFNSTTLPAQLNIAEPKTGSISDRLESAFTQPIFNFVKLTFTSDTESGNLGLCSAVPVGCQMIETGGVQTAGTVTWSDGTVDTIQFQSDVPEPSSTLPLGCVAVATLALKRRVMLAKK